MSADLGVRISELTEKDVGRWIVRTDPGMVTTEKGRLKSWSHLYIFVVFHCDNQWADFQDYTAAACVPEECRFLAPYHPVQIQDLPHE